MTMLRRVIALAAASLLALTVLSSVASPAGAASTPARAVNAAAVDEDATARHMRFGAIALSFYDTAIGFHNDKATKAGAKRAAVRQCKNRSARPGQCFTKVWVRNGCAAVRAKLRRHSSGRVSIRYAKHGFGDSLTKAKNAAKRKMNGQGRHLVAICTHRHY